jgi:hypothetical protein
VAAVAGLHRGEEEAGIYFGIWECGNERDSSGGEGDEGCCPSGEVKKQRSSDAKDGERGRTPRGGGRMAGLREEAPRSAARFRFWQRDLEYDAAIFCE